MINKPFYYLNLTINSFKKLIRVKNNSHYFISRLNLQTKYLAATSCIQDKQTVV